MAQVFPKNMTEEKNSCFSVLKGLVLSFTEIPSYSTLLEALPWNTGRLGCCEIHIFPCSQGKRKDQNLAVFSLGLLSLYMYVFIYIYRHTYTHIHIDGPVFAVNVQSSAAAAVMSLVLSKLHACCARHSVKTCGTWQGLGHSCGSKCSLPLQGLQYLARRELGDCLSWVLSTYN